jgi:hypothetical protein
MFSSNSTPKVYLKTFACEQEGQENTKLWTLIMGSSLRDMSQNELLQNFDHVTFSYQCF